MEHIVDKAREFCCRLTELEKELGVQLITGVVNGVKVDNVTYGIEVFDEDEGWILVLDEENRILHGKPGRPVPQGVMYWASDK